MTTSPFSLDCFGNSTCHTKYLATELGISDQAVTERLRRGIETLVTYAIVETAPRSDADTTPYEEYPVNVHLL